MSAAAPPSVFIAAFLALFLGLTVAGMLAVFAAMALSDAGVSNLRKLAITAAVFVGVLVVALAIGAFLHHTAWLDYRRQQ